MSRNLRGRIERLERTRAAELADPTPPGLWDALAGTVPVDQLHDRTRLLMESLHRRTERTGADEIEARIAAVGSDLSTDRDSNHRHSPRGRSTPIQYDSRSRWKAQGECEDGPVPLA